MALQIYGFSGTIADVNADRELLVALTTVDQKAGFATLVCEADPGAFTGSRYMIAPEADDDFRLRVAQDSLIFFEPFAGTALNTGVWSSTVTTMATAVSGSYLRLNSANSIATNAVARVTTYRSFPNYPSFQLYADFPLQIQAASLGIPNTTWEVGFFIASGTTTPTDGVYLRMSALGELRLVTNFAGVENQSPSIDYSALAVNTDYQVLLSVGSAEIELWIDDTLYASVDRPSGTPDFSQSLALPFSSRIYNGAVAPASATQLLIGPIAISHDGISNPLPFSDRAIMSGQGAYTTQSGATPGQTTQWANSAAPAAATLSNTAAGYTAFGGIFIFNAVAGAETDYCLFGFPVPAASSSAMNRNLIIRGVRIHTTCLGAAIATTPTVLQWAIAVGSTGVSLATAEAATTRAPRRKGIGNQSFIVGAAAGTTATVIEAKFPDSSMFCEPGSYVQVILRVPVGTATGGQSFRGIVDIDGIYE